MILKKQCKQALKETGIPVSVFCRKIGISSAAYYRWLNNDLRLSENTLNKIKAYTIMLSQIF